MTGEQSVNDLVDTVDIDQSGVSRHLRILHERGFVHRLDARVGGELHYAMIADTPEMIEAMKRMG